jgi:hypothetical protein
MNDLDIIVSALAGPSASPSDGAENVLGIVFELANAETEELMDYLECKDGYSIAVSLAGRLKALEALLTSEHMTVSFVNTPRALRVVDGGAES